MPELYLDSYTNAELINYYDCHCTDPNILRLLNALKPYVDLVDELINCGMDKDDWTFDDQKSPSEYIHYLQNDTAYYQEQLGEAEEKIAQLESRTIIDFMNDIQGRLDEKEHEVHRLRRHLTDTNNELEKTRSKLSMWTTLNAQPAQLR